MGPNGLDQNLGWEEWICWNLAWFGLAWLGLELGLGLGWIGFFLPFERFLVGQLGKWVCHSEVSYERKGHLVHVDCES
jgi:hypothetical protein